MLELRNIQKQYPAGEGKVNALRGISLQFRKSEFVSILGPSGCGKTTMLNIIGGLDRTSGGDLLINGRSTKGYGARDWDTYRNHCVGFVFQSYNLIPHQTVLANVELALTLSGVRKGERRRRAIAALEAVGLGNQLKKKPGQMSGGQMQRVAIARALVNDPDIILADEPTGALDTETSVQVMEILKEIAQRRLVIMVTHNPDLAQQYSTRIIRMLDGEILDDSNPPAPEELATAEPQTTGRKHRKRKKERRPSMNFRTAFGLSLKNLISKKGRTLLTSFAGSIGIIGIALIFAVSQGTTNYINAVQEDTLSSYPLTLQAETLDMGSMMATFISQAESIEAHENDAVYQKAMVYNMVDAMTRMETTKNDLAGFKRFLEDELAEETSELSQAVSGVQYTYNLDMQVFTENVDGTIIPADAQALMQELMIEHLSVDMSGMIAASESMAGGMASPAMSGGRSVFQEMLPGENGSLVSDVLKKQYDVIYGSWPTAYDEIVLVVDENNEIADMTLYALGLKSREEIDALARAALNKGVVTRENPRWSYEEICEMAFRVVFSADCYVYDEAEGRYADLRDSQTGMRYLYENGLPLKVSGIVRPNEAAASTMLVSPIGYTHALTQHVIENGKSSAIVQAQLEQPQTDIFTGLPFRENTGSLTDEEKQEAFRAHVAQMSEEEKAETYIRVKSIPAEGQLDAMLAQATGSMTRAQIEEAMMQAVSAQAGMGGVDVEAYLSAMSDEDIFELFGQMAAQQAKAQYAAQIQNTMAAMPQAQLCAAMDAELARSSAAQCAVYYDEIMVFSESSLENNLIRLGCLELSDPATISLYAATFESKDRIEEAIARYNEGVEEMYQIRYTDYVGLMMSSVTTIIDAITYVLIAFVAISLVVSSIMIGVITLISVQERTKEIGILRAIGASKRNVSSMFTAETVIIGFASGALGVLVTYLLCIPINEIIYSLTGIAGLKAQLPTPVAVALVIISMVLTVFAGIIPSRSAARKDPVVALRTE